MCCSGYAGTPPNCERKSLLIIQLYSHYCMYTPQLYAQSATMEELVQRLKFVTATLDGLGIPVTWVRYYTMYVYLYD